MLFVGIILIACPLIFAVEPFYHFLGDDFLEVAQQDDFILTMEVNPAGVAVLGILALHMGCLARIEYLIQRELVYVAEFHTQVLAQRHIPIRMNNQFTEYALTPQFQMAVSPTPHTMQQNQNFLPSHEYCLEYSAGSLSYLCEANRPWC